MSFSSRLPCSIQAGQLAAGAEAGVHRQHPAAAGGRGQQQLAQVAGEHPHRLLIGGFLALEPDLVLHRGPQQALVAVAHRQPHLLGAGVGPLDKAALQQLQRLLLRGGDPQHQEQLLLSAPHRQQAVRGRFRHRLLPLEPVAVLGPLLLLAGHHMGADHPALEVQPAHPLAGVGLLADPFGDDVPRPGQGGLGIRDFFFGIDIQRGLGQRVEPIALLEQGGGQGFQPAFPGDRGAGAALGTERQVDVLQLGQGLGRGDLLFQLGGQQLPLGQGLEDRLPSLVQLLELLEPVADRGHLDLIERAGGLLAVAGDERAQSRPRRAAARWRPPVSGRPPAPRRSFSSAARSELPPGRLAFDPVLNYRKSFGKWKGGLRGKEKNLFQKVFSFPPESALVVEFVACGGKIAREAGDGKEVRTGACG